MKIACIGFAMILGAGCSHTDVRLTTHPFPADVQGGLIKVQFEESQTAEIPAQDYTTSMLFSAGAY